MSASAAESELIRVTTRVSVSQAEAFTIFTEDIDLWWRRGPRFRQSHEAGTTLRLEPFVGGAFLETEEAGAVLEHGRVLTWDPPRRLVFSFGGRDFGPDEWTEVEVAFEADGDGTRVSVEHRGFEELAPDHPARHGARGNALRGLMGHWWAELLLSLHHHANQRS